MQSVFRSSGQTIVIKDCEKMSNEELCRFLEEKLPALSRDSARGDRFQQGDSDCLSQASFRRENITADRLLAGALSYEPLTFARHMNAVSRSS